MEEIYQKFISANPLLRFSIYTQLQVSFLRSFGVEIVSHLDSFFLDKSCQEEEPKPYDFNEIWGKFWLWVLGSYEVVRTMSEAKNCFENSAMGRIDLLKKNLATLRIPFAKQEYKGKKNMKIQCEASISSIDNINKDFIYSVNGQEFTIRNLIKEFNITIASISHETILNRIESGQNNT